jgi:hypothetical protein
MTPYRLPAFIVLEIPLPVRDAVQAMRDLLATPTTRLPVEITVAGSSGIGPILPGTNKQETEACLKSVVPKIKPFPVRFHEIRRFPNTNIFYLAPHDRRPFDHIHAAIKTSRIKFGSGPMNDRASAEDILKLSFPEDDFLIDTLSIYEFDPCAVACHLAFQTRL